MKMLNSSRFSPRREGLLKYKQCPYYEVGVGLGKECQCQKGVGTRVDSAPDLREICKKLKKSCLDEWEYAWQLLMLIVIA